MRNSLCYQVFSTGNSWQTAHAKLGTFQLRANGKHPKTKSEPWAAWKNKHPKKLFLELHTRKSVIWKNLEVRETKALTTGPSWLSGGKNMRVFHCGLVSFRLKHFWQIKGYLNLFWLPEEEQTSPTFHTDWSFMRMAGVSGQGEGHPGHQILKKFHVGSRKDLGHHIDREHSNSQ